MSMQSFLFFQFLNSNTFCLSLKIQKMCREHGCSFQSIPTISKPFKFYLGRQCKLRPHSNQRTITRDQQLVAPNKFQTEA
ncbi:hypothetical protein RB195_006316 [Necator americanus]|uniref:Uncharacterized protein n=1 Tax=Necator americanus TaxID=51031 RepID=A0ABR1BS38_NECAM